MTFANTKQSTKTTVVFFPHALKGSLVNALQKENLTGWEILKWADAEKKYGAKCPRDENGRPSIRIYPDIPGTTNQIKAFVSNFNADDILTKSTNYTTTLTLKHTVTTCPKQSKNLSKKMA